MAADWDWLISERYGPDLICRVVGLDGAAPPPRPDAGISLRAVFQPSFHSELVVTLVGDESGGVGRVHAVRNSLWYFMESLPRGSSLARRLQRWRAARGYGSPADPPEPAPDPVSAEFTPGAAAWRRVVELARGDVSPREPEFEVLDGIGVYIHLRREDGDAQLDLYSVHEGQPVWDLVLAVFDLAYEGLMEHELCHTVERIRSYLHDGPGYRLVSASPFHLRVFHWPYTDEHTEFFQLLESTPIDAPAIIDLTNLEGMGTIWRPYLHRFAQARPRAVWAANPNIRRELLEAGLPATRLVGTIAEAHETVRTLSP